MSLTIFHERRDSERRPTQLAVKVYDAASGRYIGGVMRNISASGALLELRGAIASRIGDRVALASEGDARGGVVKRSQMTPAVVRRLAEAGTASRMIAVEFAPAQVAAMAA